MLPDWLRGRPQEIAVDFHDEPYYGRDDPEDDDNWVCCGEAHAGTTRFYRCATAYLMLHDVRLTLAVVFVIGVGVLDDNHSSQSGLRARMRKPTGPP